jgi:hypothetical protein
MSKPKLRTRIFQFRISRAEKQMLEHLSDLLRVPMSEVVRIAIRQQRACLDETAKRKPQ